MVTLHGLIQRLKSYNHTVSQNKQHDMKVLFDWQSILPPLFPRYSYSTLPKYKFENTNKLAAENKHKSSRGNTAVHLFSRMLTLNLTSRDYEVEPHCVTN